MGEEWREIPGFEGYYEASDAGRVRGVDRFISYQSRYGLITKKLRGRVLRDRVAGKGDYPLVDLCREGVQTTRTVHSLVAEAFLGPCPSGMEVCHEDGEPSHCNLSNLRYDTPSNNQLDKRKHGTVPKGERAPRSRLTEVEVRRIREYRGALTQRALAAMFGVGQAAIFKIQKGQNWGHVL